jgi:predicted dehydrogenase
MVCSNIVFLNNSRKIKTKVAFIFRYSPLIRRMKELITEGFIGEPFHFNGFIQNPNYIDAMAPFPLTPTADSIAPGSIQEYSPHLIDLALWLNGDLIAVVGLMKNFIPKRTIRDYGEMMRANFDDGCVWLAEFENGAQATFQTSFVALGPRPGLEIRIMHKR